MQALEDITITFSRVNHQNHTFLNGQDVESSIRSMAVSDMVSEVASISAVRRFLVHQQQEMAKLKGIVMDGRDIGTVVFPSAEIKIFLTAQPDVRARRRQLEFQSKGIELSLAEIAQNIAHRDHIDSTRSDSPLKQAIDAILLDNSELSREEQLKKVLNIIQAKINS